MEIVVKRSFHSSNSFSQIALFIYSNLILSGRVCRAADKIYSNDSMWISHFFSHSVNSLLSNEKKIKQPLNFALFISIMMMMMAMMTMINNQIEWILFPLSSFSFDRMAFSYTKCPWNFEIAASHHISPSLFGGLAEHRRASIEME